MTRIKCVPGTVLNFGEAEMVERYGVWNNKGGVGKSTITYHLASALAAKEKNKNVLVIDLCPQANVSMMLLGGGTKGEDAVLSQCTLPTPTTVVGYLSDVLSGGERAPLPDPNKYITQVSKINSHMTSNLFLLCGDGNLEPMAPAINRAADAPALLPTASPWRWVHEVFRKLSDNLPNPDNWVVFIDTNPSFSIYTELAISACDKLIVPVNADDSSRVATNAMFILLHGTVPPHPVYGTWTFAVRAKANGLTIPKVHLIVGNRLTSYSGVAAAFEALSNATANTLYAAYGADPSHFTPRSTAPSSIKKFRNAYSVPLRDFNTAGVMSAHLGMRMDSMTQGTYQVHGLDVQVKAGQIAEARQAINSVLAAL